jgi:hypothetical protein
MRALIIVLIVALGGGAVIQTLRYSRLAAQNENLARQVAELHARIAALPDGLAIGAQPNAMSDEERSELLRLRNQAAQLRSATNELRQTRKQIDQLQVDNERLKTASSSGVAAPAAATAGGMRQRDSWQFLGYATPEACLESVLYGISKADYNTIMGSLTPKEAQRLQKQFDAANKSPEEVAENIRRDVAKTTSYQVLERKDISPNESMLLIYGSGEDKVQRVLLQKIGEEWKFAGSADRRGQRD